MLNSLPGDVQASIAGNQVLEKGVSLLPVVEKPGADEGIVRKEEVEGKTAGFGGEDAIVQCSKVREIGFAIRIQGLRRCVHGEQRTANMGEPVMLASVEPRIKRGLIDREKRS